MDEYTYYFFYMKDEYAEYYDIDSVVYAFTDNKKLKKMFMSTRDMNMFKVEKKKLNRIQRRVLLEEHSNLSLSLFHFDDGLSIPLTNEEKSVMTFIANDTINIKLITIASCVNPRVFSKDILPMIKDIGYLKFYKYYSLGVPLPNIRPDFFKIFLKYYGKTLSL